MISMIIFIEDVQLSHSLSPVIKSPHVRTVYCILFYFLGNISQFGGKQRKSPHTTTENWMV